MNSCYRAVATGKVTKVLGLTTFCWAGFGQTNFFQSKNKIPFYTKQVINRSARVILALLGLLYYSTVNREAVSRVGKLSAAHVHDLFQCSEGRKLSYKQSASVVFKSGRLKTLCQMSSGKYIGRP